MLNKQSIRGGVQIYADGLSLNKEQIITISENWSENQELFFRKMLKQSGNFTLKGTNFKIVAPEPTRDSKGEISTYLREESED
jgi:hypothetical protein